MPDLLCLRLFAALLAGSTMACSPQAATDAQAARTAHEQVHPVSGLPVIPLAITGRSGEHRFLVEVARTPQQQAQGLMFRTTMGENEGMLFPYSGRSASFWMRNTVLPLDLIFIGPDRRVLNIAADAVPYSEERIRSAGPVIGVLELNGGRAAQLGIAPGDLVTW